MTVKKLIIADNGFDTEKFQLDCYRNGILIDMRNIKKYVRGPLGKEVRQISCLDAKRPLKDTLKLVESSAKAQGFECKAGKSLSGVLAFIIYPKDNPKARVAEVIHSVGLFTVYDPPVLI